MENFLALLALALVISLANGQVPVCPGVPKCAGCAGNTTRRVTCSLQRLTEFPILPLEVQQSVEYLTLRYNSINTLERNDLQNYTNLQTLKLSGNHLSSLPDNLFVFSHLTTLDLSHNSIENVTRATFSGMQPNSTINLEDNQIQTIPRGAFSRLGQIKEINLHDNPLRCDCGLRWFPGFLANSPPLLPLKATCASPAALSGQDIQSLSTGSFTCECQASCGNGICDSTVGRCLCSNGFFDDDCSTDFCSSLETIASGSISYSAPSRDDGNYRPGTVAVYTCDGLYTLVGSNSRVCGEDRKWSGTKPTCGMVTCKELNAPAGGVIVYSEDTTPPFDMQTTVTYSCNSGFQLVGGNAQRTCVHTDGSLSFTGEWDGSAPTCEYRCPPLPVPEHANISYTVNPDPDVLVDTIATTVCQQDYWMASGDQFRQCSSDGTWTGEDAVCEVLLLGSEVAVIITLSGYTTETFDKSVQMRFKETTARVVNLYCGQQNQQCHLSEQQSEVKAAIDDVIISNIWGNSSSVTFSVSVITETLNLPPETLKQAMEDEMDQFEVDQFGGIMIALGVVSITTTLSPAENPPTTYEDVVGKVLAGTLLPLGAILISVGAAVGIYKYCRRKEDGFVRLT